MKKLILMSAVCGLTFSLIAGQAQAQKKGKGQKAKAEKEVAAEVTPEETAPEAVPENTLETCQDSVDNDLDTYTDCDDQDCGIFAACVKKEAPKEDPVPVKVVEIVRERAPMHETGRMCRDGKDNNGDGLIDCFEESCQHYRYCKKKMYYIPEPEDKAPGLFITTGGGVALPGFRGSDETASSAVDNYNTDVDLDPEYGFMTDLQIGYLPTKYVGFGVNFKLGATLADNWRDNEDYYDNHYKGRMLKGFGHVGAFIRVQYPFKRFVPYLNIAGGYSSYYREYNVYNGDEDWEDIWSGDDDDLDYSHERTVERDQQFTMALEPGFDIFVRQRSIAVGLRAWLPVVGSSDSKLDNVGVMVNVTFTPMWREKRTLRPEYQNPASTMEEETGEPVSAEPAAEEPAKDEIDEPAPVEGPVEGDTAGGIEEGSLTVSPEEPAATDSPSAVE